MEATHAYEVGNADGKPMSLLGETLELVIYTLDGEGIGLGTQETAERALGDGGASQENAFRSQPLPLLQGVYEARTDGKKLEIPCEIHALSA